MAMKGPMAFAKEISAPILRPSGWLATHLGFGRVVVSETAPPNIFANLG
jgi:hypothetical protein